MAQEIEVNQESLEILFVDKFGVSNVLGMLSEICDGKADHIRANWQDENLAQRWEEVAVCLNRLQIKVSDIIPHDDRGYCTRTDRMLS